MHSGGLSQTVANRPGAVLRDRQKRPKAEVVIKINPTSFYVLLRNLR